MRKEIRPYDNQGHVSNVAQSYRILNIVYRCLLYVNRSVLILGALRLGEQACLRNVVESGTERLFES